MVGPGTGVAPFRSFWQERHAVSAPTLPKPHLNANPADPHPHATLFFGCQSEQRDFLYRDELHNHHSSGLLRLHTAFSRDQDHKIYVQHRIGEQAEQLGRVLLQDNAHVYVCGDARQMPHDVRAALVKSLQAGGGLSAEDAEKRVREMEQRGRYQTDVWF